MIKIKVDSDRLYFMVWLYLDSDSGFVSGLGFNFKVWFMIMKEFNVSLSLIYMIINYYFKVIIT